MTATLTAPVICVTAIHSDADLIRAQERIEVLWGSSSGTPEGDELEILSDLVEAYERRHFEIPNTGGIGVLRALMEGNGLTQSDLPEIGNQSVVSQIFSGKRHLNARMALALAKRFKMPVSAFLQEP